MTVLDTPVAPRRFEWPCQRCAPHVARLVTRSWLVVLMVHGVECDLPVEHRTTVVLRFPRGGQGVGQVGMEGPAEPSVRPAGRPDRASAGLVDDAQQVGRLPGRGARSPAGPPAPVESTTPTGVVPELLTRGPVGDGTTEGA